MICPGCGSSNRPDSLVCHRCHLVFPQAQRSPETSGRVHQSPPRTVSDVLPPLTEEDTIHYPEVDEQSLKMQQAPFASVTRHTPPPPPESGLGFLPVVIGGFGIVILALLIVLFWPERPASTSMPADAYYAEAEQMLEEGNVIGARKFFAEFLKAAPESPLAEIARSKIVEIDSRFKPEQEAEIDQLMDSALVAFQKRRYVTPDSDNVLLYLNQILALDADNPEALQLRGMVQTIYRRDLQEALAKEQYKSAEAICRKMLLLDPTDAEVLTHLRTIAANQ